MSKFGRKHKSPPEGFEYVESTLTALDNEIRERVNEPHEGLRKNESQWPVHQINWQRSRYIYDLYYTFHKISKQVYDYCIENKVVDPQLIAKWKKAGYERLCSTYVINPRNYKFGTVSICRVPKQSLAAGTVIEDPMTGCRGCASGSGGEKNIFGNKYGQYLAAIQVAREDRMAQMQKAAEQHKGVASDEDSDDSDGSNEDNRDSSSNSDDDNDDIKTNKQYEGPVGAADGSSGVKASSSVWANAEEEEAVDLSEDLLGVLSSEAVQEGRLAAKHAAPQTAGKGKEAFGGPPEKRMRS